MQFKLAIQLTSMLLMFQIDSMRSVDTGCFEADWWHSFDLAGWSVCPCDRYIKGFWRNDQQPGFDNINALEKPECCLPTISKYNEVPLGGFQHGQQPTTCSTAQWQYTLDRQNVWALCPSGYFLSGLNISMAVGLSNIEEAKCCHPATHPDGYGNCYDEDVSSSFDSKGWSKCQSPGYFMTGIYKSNCNGLYCIEKFKCCSMKAPSTSEGPPIGK